MLTERQALRLALEMFREIDRGFKVAKFYDKVEAMEVALDPTLGDCAAFDRFLKRHRGSGISKVACFDDDVSPTEAA